jgi:hypothetical protein
MDRNDAEQFRSQLGEMIGRDIVYVTAADEQRHFDPITFVQQYAGEVFLLFVSVAATTLYSKIKQGAADLGKKIGEQIWGQAEESLKQLTDADVTQDNEAQLVAIPKASNSVAVLGKTLGESYLDEFLAAGQGAVEDRLIRDNFPRAKAARISSDFARRIREQVHD